MVSNEALLIIFVMNASLYAYVAICLQRIALGLGLPHAWFAWVPVLDVYIACRIAGHRYLWTLLSLIPLVNIVMSVLLCFRIARACGKGRLSGFLLLVPVVDFFVLWGLVESVEGREAAGDAAPDAGEALDTGARA